MNSELITVNLTSEKFSDVTYDGKPLTLEVSKLYSHFGISYNEKYDNFSLPVDVPEDLFDDLKLSKQKSPVFLKRGLRPQAPPHQRR